MRTHCNYSTSSVSFLSTIEWCLSEIPALIRLRRFLNMAINGSFLWSELRYFHQYWNHLYNDSQCWWLAEHLTKQGFPCGCLVAFHGHLSLPCLRRWQLHPLTSSFLFPHTREASLIESLRCLRVPERTQHRSNEEVSDGEVQTSLSSLPLPNKTHDMLHRFCDVQLPYQLLDGESLLLEIFFSFTCTTDTGNLRIQQMNNHEFSNYRDEMQTDWVTCEASFFFMSSVSSSLSESDELVSESKKLLRAGGWVLRPRAATENYKWASILHSD